MESASPLLQRADLVIRRGQVVKSRRGETGLAVGGYIGDGYYIEIDYGENWQSPFPEPQMEAIDRGIDFLGFEEGTRPKWVLPVIACTVWFLIGLGLGLWLA